MQLIIGWIVGGFLQATATFVGKVLISLLIGYVVYTGVDASMAYAKSQFISGMAHLPTMAVQLAGLLKIGGCVSLLLSALTTRLVMGGLTGGAIKRMVVK